MTMTQLKTEKTSVSKSVIRRIIVWFNVFREVIIKYNRFVYFCYSYLSRNVIFQPKARPFFEVV